jgi:arginyl-tRNA synthetase
VFARTNFKYARCATRLKSNTSIMSTVESNGLWRLLDDLSLSSPSLEYVEVDILANPLDICRTILASVLSNIVGCDQEEAYKSIQWPNNIFNGDLSVTLPRLRPGCKPNELSSELVDKVGIYPDFERS